MLRGCLRRFGYVFRPRRGEYVNHKAVFKYP